MEPDEIMINWKMTNSIPRTLSDNYILLFYLDKNQYSFLLKLYMIPMTLKTVPIL